MLSRRSHLECFRIQSSVVRREFLEVTEGTLSLILGFRSVTGRSGICRTVVVETEVKGVKTSESTGIDVSEGVTRNLWGTTRVGSRKRDR